MRNLGLIGLLLLAMNRCMAAADEDDWRSRCYSPTTIVKAADTYFLVDCWHHRVLWSKSFPVPIDQWKTLDEDLVEPHSVASDGTLYAVDETGRDRLCVYRLHRDGFQMVQRIERLGHRPHRTIYDAETAAYYVLSCASTDITKLVRQDDRLVVRYTKHLDFLQGEDCRSMAIFDGAMYFVAGPEAILKTTYRDDRYRVIARYPVPKKLNGLADQNDLFHTDDGWWYMTATPRPIARARSLDGLCRGQYEIVSDQLGLRGTPYYLSRIDGRYYLPQITEHNGIISFIHRDGRIADVRVLYDFGPPIPADLKRRQRGEDLGVPLVSVPDPSAPLRPETAQQQASRHAEVARARGDTVLLLHKGAAETAPENTLSAIRIGQEMGCSGAELDFRRTRDGVIVLYHDDRLEHRLDGFGAVEDSYYEELLLYTPRGAPSPADGQGIAALRDVLQLIRDCHGLMVLDIKSPGISGRLLEELRDAGMLDHVAGFNETNAEAFEKAEIRPLPFKGALIGSRADLEPLQVQAMLRRPGKIVFLDDPRAALPLLGRPAKRIETRAVKPLRVWDAWLPEPLEAVLRGESKQLPVRLAAVRLANSAPQRLVRMAAELARQPGKETRRALAWNLGMIAKHRGTLLDAPSRAALLGLLSDPEMAVRAEAAVACGRAKLRAAVPRVTELLAETLADRPARNLAPNPGREALLNARGHYAFALGLLGERNPAVAAALVETFRHREAGPNPMWLGVDGAMAAWALGELRVEEAVAPLREALLWQPPLGWTETEDEGQPLRWFVYWDLQVPRFVPEALARIGNREALDALQAVLPLNDTEAARRSPELLARTADALAGFPVEDRSALLAKLLVHGAPQVRGAAILKCLREPEPGYRSPLETNARWALPWWDAQHGTAKP